MQGMPGKAGEETNACKHVYPQTERQMIVHLYMCSLFRGLNQN